jgi:magnesium transporter
MPDPAAPEIERPSPLGCAATCPVNSTAPGVPDKPIIEFTTYGPQGFVSKSFSDASELAPSYSEKQQVTWVNVERMGDAKVVADIGAIFGLHPLSLEDVLQGNQRPKVEEYNNHHFIIARMVSLGEELHTEQLSMFFTKDFVVTFQECPGDCLGPVRARIKEPSDRSRNMGADYLAYSILDALVDSYFPILEEYGERLEALEDEIVANPLRETLSRLHDIKRDLLTLRRATWPLRDAINALLRDPLGIITKETNFYMRDCYDHLIQIIDLEENYRELASDLMDIYLSSISNRMNEVMKVLTVIATIFMPLTFIAGLYGMNFNTKASPLNMPELNWFFGYPFVLILCAGIALWMVVVFKKKGWM